MSITLAQPDDMLVWVEQDICITRAQAEAVVSRGYLLPHLAPLEYPVGHADHAQVYAARQLQVDVMLKLGKLGLYANRQEQQP